MGFWDGSGVSWTICKKYAPRSREITTPTPYHSIFTRRMLFLTPNQQCQSTEGIALTVQCNSVAFILFNPTDPQIVFQLFGGPHHEQVTHLSLRTASFFLQCKSNSIYDCDPLQVEEWHFPEQWKETEVILEYFLTCSWIFCMAAHTGPRVRSSKL